MADLDLTEITAARRLTAEHADRLRGLDVELAGAAVERDRGLARGDRAATDSATAAIADLGRARIESVTAVAQARARISALSDALIAGSRPEDAVGTLAGRHPVMMLPVRIETRFTDGGTTLKVRIFPDQVHVTAHDPALTEAEEEGLRWYWEHRWPDRGDDGLADEAWEELGRRLRPGRAAFLVRTYPPGNLDSGDAAPTWDALPRRAAAWSRAARAALLPDRWCVLGFRRDAEGRHTEIFRVWGSRVPDTLAAGPAPDLGEPGEPGGLPDDPELRWLHDPAAAAAAGMLVTVGPSDLRAGADLTAGVDRLLAVGVDWTLDAEQATAAVTEHLRAHADEGRLAFVPQGVATNSTGSERSGFSTDPEAARVALAPHRTPARADGAAAPTVAAALGVAPDLLAHVPGADLREQAWQRALVDALWPATGGYFLTEMLDPVCEDPSIEQALRDHAVGHLRSAGPLPTLRIGPQPYGVLPVTPRGFTPTPGRRAQADVLRVAGLFRELVEPLVAQVPRLGRIRRREDVDDVLLALLQRTPVPWSFAFRQLVGPVQRKAVSVYWDLLAAFQRDVTATVFTRLGCQRLTLLSELTHDERDHPLRVPLVLRPEPTTADPAAQGTGYLSEISELLVLAGGRALLDGRQDAVALLEAFLACAAVRELDGAAKQSILQVGTGLSPEFLAFAARRADRVPYVLRVESAGTVAPAAAASAVGVPRTPLELATTVVPAITGNATLAEHVASMYRAKRAAAAAVLNTPDDPLHRLARLDEAVRVLVDAPADQLEWALRGTLDLYSTRLDAWVTSLANARLAELRSAAPTGVHIGGWGVVEDLRPDVGPAADSLGYLAAPSLGHAAALAVMRSARLAHRGDNGEVFDLDLSSARVRAALQILEGLGSGQRLAALLGYRVERGLQQRSLELARWILPLRRQCPLRSDRPDDPDQVEPVEEVAARDVVDGIALLARWAADRDGLLDSAGVAGAARADVAVVLDDVAELADAVSDVLVSEAVHQATAGNLERSGAALAAHDRQAPPPDPEFVRTPRAGAVPLHRVGIWCPRDAVTPAPGWQRDLRSAAEPRFDRWVGEVLGDPARWAVRARLVPAAGTPPVDLAPITVGALGLGALSLVMAARQPSASQPSELEMRLAVAFGAAAERDAGRVPDADDQLEIDPGSLAPVLDLASWVEQIAGTAPLAPAHLAPLADLSSGALGAAAVVDASEARSRADAVRTAVGQRVDALARAVTALATAPDGVAELAALSVALLDVAPIAGPDAVDPAAAADLHTHGAAVLDRVQNAVAAADAVLAAPDADLAGAAGEDPAVVRSRAAVRFMLGADQPFLPVLVPTDPVPLSVSLADRAALLAGDPTAAAIWLHRSALVRPALDPLAAMLVHAEADGADVAGDLAVVQSPHRPGAPWVALPFGAAGPPPDGTVGLVLHAPEGLDPVVGGAGLIVDAWTDSVPADSETTAVTFHYDAPGARPPQAVLLAVHPEPGAEAWSFDHLVGCVHEAMDLARLRTVGSAELAGFATFLPALFLPDDYTRDVPGLRLRELVFNAELRGLGGLLGAHVLGKVQHG